MFEKKIDIFESSGAIYVRGLSDYSLIDTMECGQCFRAVQMPRELAHMDGEDYTEYMTVIGERLVFVGQRIADELIFHETDTETVKSVFVPYFSLDRDYTAVREDIISHTSSEFLKEAAYLGRGIRILRQDPWEAILSFIISQNNNIPRIRRIIGAICAHYGKNLGATRLGGCPLGKCHSEGENPSEFDTSPCLSCGMCYTFPGAEDILSDPEGLLPSHPGFRYKYMLDAAAKVAAGEVDIQAIISHASYSFTKDELMKICGVGEKVASCVALFAFDNLDAFPIDVWMKRAIEVYFDGSLDPATLGAFAGVAQQYIFHKIRNLKE